MSAPTRFQQLYLGAPPGRVARPPRELRGFTSVDLAPGESTHVAFTPGARDLAYWSSTHRPRAPIVDDDSAGTDEGPGQSPDQGLAAWGE
jgi:hypothetical protein